MYSSVYYVALMLHVLCLLLGLSRSSSMRSQTESMIDKEEVKEELKEEEPVTEQESKQGKMPLEIVIKMRENSTAHVL